MAQEGTGRVVRELMDEPHLRGRRISVRHLHEQVEGRGLEPRTVADRLGLDVADVYRALAYYHEHPDEMHAVERRREERIETSCERGAITGPDDLQMSYRLLLDEMTEASLADYLGRMGHDVERVVDRPELGPGSGDESIVRYAERERRLLLTYDDDFLSNQDILWRIGVLFQSNGRVPAFDTANIVNEISKHVDQEQVAAHEGAFHLTERWL